MDALRTAIIEPFHIEACPSQDASLSLSSGEIERVIFVQSSKHICGFITPTSKSSLGGISSEARASLRQAGSPQEKLSKVNWYIVVLYRRRQSEEQVTQCFLDLGDCPRLQRWTGNTDILHQTPYSFRLTLR